MICTNCGSDNVNVQVSTNTYSKSTRGILWWLFVSWWWLPLKWLLFTFPALFTLGKSHKKTVTKQITFCVCQNCANRWEV